MINIPSFGENPYKQIHNDISQTPVKVKIEQEQPQCKISFYDGSGFEVQNGGTIEAEFISKESPLIQSTPSPAILLIQSTQPIIINHSQVSKTPTQIVEENDAKLNINFKPQNNQLFSSSWFLPRHPNSLFKTITTKQKTPTKRASKKLLKVIPVNSVKSICANGEAEAKQSQVKGEQEVKLANPQPKTKTIHKNPNFKPRKGKNQQPMAQKFIKKLSGFHYNKNYKQNRNKTLKKLAKRGLAINIQNFSECISKLKLEINKKFTKPEMKPKTNSKGEEINPKKSYDSYHSHFPQIRQREFIERFYNEVFKRVYVIMWKSDERLKRINSIKIEGVQYDNNLVQTDPSSEVKIENKSGDEDKQLITESRLEDKRAMFVQCLDEQGKSELERVFNEEFQKLYEKFSWGDFTGQPDKDTLRKRVERFCWIQD